MPIFLHPRCHDQPQVNEGKLPTHMFCLYCRYKKGTESRPGRQLCLRSAARTSMRGQALHARNVSARVQTTARTEPVTIQEAEDGADGRRQRARRQTTVNTPELCAYYIYIIIII